MEKLLAEDPEFKDWKEEMGVGVIMAEELQVSEELRRKKFKEITIYTINHLANVSFSAVKAEVFFTLDSATQVSAKWTIRVKKVNTSNTNDKQHFYLKKICIPAYSFIKVIAYN